VYLYIDAFYVCMRVRACIYIYGASFFHLIWGLFLSQLYMYVCVCARGSIYICMYVCNIYVYIYMYVYVYICICIYIYIHRARIYIYGASFILSVRVRPFVLSLCPLSFFPFPVSCVYEYVDKSIL